MNWEEMTLWQKITDKDPSRPPKTLGNILHWTLPFWYLGSDNHIPTTQRRFKIGKFESHLGEKPYLEIRLKKLTEPTYQNRPFSRAIRIHWCGWLWGWK